MNLFLDEIKISQKLNNLDPFLINRETSGQKRLFFPPKSGKIFAKSGQTGHNLQNLRAQSFLPFSLRVRVRVWKTCLDDVKIKGIIYEGLFSSQDLALTL